MREISVYKHQPSAFTAESASKSSMFSTPLIPALGLMLAAVLLILLGLFGLDWLSFGIERPYLIPWVLAMGAVIVAPSAYWYYKGEFSLVNPITFASLTYFFPIFFLGGWSLVFGLSRFYYIAYISDPVETFQLVFFYLIVGFASLCVGYFLPWGKKIGHFFARRLPIWNWQSNSVILPSLLFLGFGIIASYVALEFGQIGYNSADAAVGETGSFSYFLAMTMPVSTFMLWLAVFRSEKRSTYWFVVIGVQIIAAVWMLIVLGGRSSLLQSLALAVFAYTMAGRKFKSRQLAYLSVLLPVFIFFGMIYGTAFRNVKGSMAKVSVIEYVGVAFDTIGSIGNQDFSSSAGEVFDLLAERLEIASSLGVVVSNYEKLQVYEASYGLENNIWTYTWTAFIPRLIWQDKPKIADNYSYNELYFNYGGFGLAITAVGDLLRNFGPWGIPLGMLLLGFGLRILYATFVEGQYFSIWRSSLYFACLYKISYDSFYGEILPTVIRVSLIIFIQLFFINLLIKVFRRN